MLLYNSFHSNWKSNLQKTYDLVNLQNSLFVVIVILVAQAEKINR